jgi:hypothetical protein
MRPTLLDEDLVYAKYRKLVEWTGDEAVFIGDLVLLEGCEVSAMHELLIALSNEGQVALLESCSQLTPEQQAGALIGEPLEGHFATTGVYSQVTFVRWISESIGFPLSAAPLTKTQI